MQLYPCFYFRPLPNPITLSHFFNIQIRNLLPDEIPLFAHNIQTLCQKLSDKERRRILYTLYPLGDFNTEGTLEEQFVRELTKIWVVASSDKKLPFEKGLYDYGLLCGYLIDDSHKRNPSGFVCDIQNLTSREILRALKTELPKAATQLLNKQDFNDDIQQLTIEAAYWDGVFSKNYTHAVQLAKSLRLAQENKDILQKLLQYCITAEILLVHNPSKEDSKMPINRQFTSKLTLVRHMMIKLKNQSPLYPPEEIQKIFSSLYDMRSNILHGREHRTSKRQIAQYLNILYPTIRLTMELQRTDPLLIEFIKKI